MIKEPTNLAELAERDNQLQTKLVVMLRQSQITSDLFHKYLARHMIEHKKFLDFFQTQNVLIK